MAKTLILFNLKSGVSVEDYEDWAKKAEITTINGLQSVDGFQAFKTTGPMFPDGNCPYAYVEMLDVRDADAFQAALSCEPMSPIAVSFEAMVDKPIYINIEPLM